MFRDVNSCINPFRVMKRVSLDAVECDAHVVCVLVSLQEIHTVKHEITGSSADSAVCNGHQKSESGVQARLR